MLKLEHRQELVDGKFETMEFTIVKPSVYESEGVGMVTKGQLLTLSLPELQELKKLLNNMTEI